MLLIHFFGMSLESIPQGGSHWRKPSRQSKSKVISAACPTDIIQKSKVISVSAQRTVGIACPTDISQNRPRQLPSSFFLLPSSFFLLPSSFFLLPSSFFLLPSSFLLPTQSGDIPKARALCTIP